MRRGKKGELLRPVRHGPRHDFDIGEAVPLHVLRQTLAHRGVRLDRQHAPIGPGHLGHEERVPSDIGPDIHRDPTRFNETPDQLTQLRLILTEEKHMVADGNGRVGQKLQPVTHDHPLGQFARPLHGNNPPHDPFPASRLANERRKPPQDVCTYPHQSVAATRLIFAPPMFMFCHSPIGSSRLGSVFPENRPLTPANFSTFIPWRSHVALV